MQPKESKTSTHFWISLVKSSLRFGAAAALFTLSIEIAAVLFAFAEVLGVAEEVF